MNQSMYPNNPFRRISASPASTIAVKSAKMNVELLSDEEAMDVEIHPAAYKGADGHSPYIGEDGYWYEYDDAAKQWKKTDVHCDEAAAQAALDAAAQATASSGAANAAAKSATDAAGRVDASVQAATDAASKAAAAATRADESADKADDSATKADAATANANTATNRANAAAEEAEKIVVEKNIATKDYVNEQIDGIEIGGRNLLPGTKDFSDGLLSGVPTGTYLGLTVSRLTLDGNIYRETGNYSPIPDVFKPDTDYTLSFYAKGTVSKIRSFWYPNCVAPLFDGRTDGAFETSITTTWNRYSIHYHTLPAYTYTGKENIIVCRIGQETEATNGQYVDICGIKLEEGNKATDWSPAPEDVDAKILGTNLLMNSEAAVENRYYALALYRISQHGRDLAENELVTLSFDVELGDDRTFIRIFSDNGFTSCAVDITRDKIKDGKCSITFNWKKANGNDPVYGVNEAFALFDYPREATSETRIANVKLERGNIATAWTPAPEDVDPRRAGITYDYGGRNLREVFGTAEKLHNALAAEDYTNIAVGDYWPITLNGTFRDYGSYFVPLTAKFYTTPALGDENAGGTSSKTWEGNYYSEGVVTYTINTPPYDVRYVRESDCLPYFERTCNNVTVKLEVAGINHYWRYGDTGELAGNKPHIVFVSRDCLPFWMRMRKNNDKWEDETATNPWLGSALYKTLNETEHGIIHLLKQTELEQYIYSGPNGKGMRAVLEVKKRDELNASYFSWYDRGELFFPSSSEIWGSPFFAEECFDGGLSNQFAIFSNSRRHISKGWGDGGTKDYWCSCSSKAGSNYEFASVHSGNFASYRESVGVICVPICFIFI